MCVGCGRKRRDQQEAQVGDDAADLFELLHQILLRLQTACRIDNAHLCASFHSLSHGPMRDQLVEDPDLGDADSEIRTELKRVLGEFSKAFVEGRAADPR